MCSGQVLPEWWGQGGKATVQSFNKQSLEQITPHVAVHLQVPGIYRNFFYEAVQYHMIDDEESPDTVFVHGGFNYNFGKWNTNLGKHLFHGKLGRLS